MDPKNLKNAGLTLPAIASQQRRWRNALEMKVGHTARRIMRVVFAFKSEAVPDH
jgi:hypothetical protein